MSRAAARSRTRDGDARPRAQDGAGGVRRRFRYNIPQPMPERLTEPTADQLRTRYPEFADLAGVTDADIGRAAHVAVRLTALSEDAVLAATAHIVAVNRAPALPGETDGGMGEIASDKTGPTSRQYVTLADAQCRSDGWWATSVYGREFVMLRRTSSARAFSMHTV